MEERVLTIPLTKALTSALRKRSPRAVRVLRELLRRHVKSDRVMISERVNEFIWARGIKKPPRCIRVKTVKDKEGAVKVYLATEEIPEDDQ
ncbi:TPA: 50S ribosomal protein L31e [Candidatus Bathyarchaeota archaeon]|nr:50S ribosomal protein L31e [Candidatus Bathyarchaeota archaeon]